MEIGSYICYNETKQTALENVRVCREPFKETETPFNRTENGTTRKGEGKQ